jgi:hypothetical protein
MPGDRRRGPTGLRRANETLQARAAAEAVMDEAARQDATLAAAEAPLPQYFVTDDESSSDDVDFVPASEPVSEFVGPTTTRQEVPHFPASERLSPLYRRSQLHMCLSRTSSLLLSRPWPLRHR